MLKTKKRSKPTEVLILDLEDLVNLVADRHTHVECEDKIFEIKVVSKTGCVLN